MESWNRSKGTADKSKSQSPNSIVVLITSSMILRSGLTTFLENVIDLQNEKKNPIIIEISAYTNVLLNRMVSEETEESILAENILQLLSKSKKMNLQKGNGKNVWEEREFVVNRAELWRDEGSLRICSCDKVLNSMLRFRFKKRSEIALRDITENGALTDKIAFEEEAVFDSPQEIQMTLESMGRFSSHIPRKGDYVITEQGGEYHLTEQIAEGEEARIYAVSRTKCVKIFRLSHNTGIKMKKIQELCEYYPEFCKRNPALANRIAFPEEIVYNDEKYPVGFLMKRFDNVKSLKDYDFRTIQEEIHGFSRWHQLRMAISLTELVIFTTENHLFLGDILTPQNILFDNEQNAYLIDIDSSEFTINEVLHPAQSRLTEHLPPERIKEKNLSFFYQEEDDAWALQMILFTVIITENPYIREENFPLEDNIYYGRYPYQSGDSDRTNGIRSKRLYDIMTYIPKFLRNDFYHSFSLRGSNFRRETRFTAKKWLSRLLKYYRILPELIDIAEESESIRPTHRNIIASEVQ